mmetsp:Transcript_23747/g.55242  ORF Transcript_23747/g.55242 Transcript_23747/m.55242 type:complete len:105 (+) Transcript_23747:1475-1789(+)
MRFNKALLGEFHIGDELGTYATFAEIFSTLAIQLAIACVCDLIADIILNYRRTPWHYAWSTMDRKWVFKCSWIYFASTAMFLFYFYPFLTSRMCTKLSCVLHGK